MEFHLKNPLYIRERMRLLFHNFSLRVLLVLLDVSRQRANLQIVHCLPKKPSK